MLKREEVHIRDPFILLEGDYYYMYGTCNAYNWQEAKKKREALVLAGKSEAEAEKEVPVPSGTACYKSKDLENWEGPYPAFTYSEGFWGTHSYWAPEVFKVKDKFYMFITFFSDREGRRCQILVSSKPEGPYTPHAEPYTPPGQWCLDGTLFEFKGKYYSVYCHEWLQVKDGKMCITELSDDLKRPIGEPITIFTASQAPWSEGGKDGNFVTDGPFLWTLPSGKIVMMWSTGGKNGYTMGMAINDGEDITKGWTQIKEPLYEGGGHGMIFKDKNGQLNITVHAPNHGSLERPYFIPIRMLDDRLERIEK